jgi:hypothetical protein
MGGAPAGMVAIPVPHDTLVPVAVKLSSAGRTIFAGDVTAPAHKLQPNGPGCSPTFWRIELRAHKDGSVSGLR